MNTIVFLFYSLISRKKQGHKSEVAPSQFHRSSIASPSKRWSIDGLSMDNRWIIFEGRTKTDAGDDRGFSVLCPTDNKSGCLEFGRFEREK